MKSMNPTFKNILEIHNLSNRYEGQPLLREISFTLKKGEILSLLGPSGSGKTTLLRLIAGLEKEDTGTIIFRGSNIKNVPPHKRQFGMMFQEYALFPHKNVWQNVAFGLEMKKCRLPEKAERIENILKIVGLAGFDQRKIDDLSGGERQRVALARSLAPEPKLLLLDEPFGSLDRTLRDRLTGEVRGILTSLGVTAIFVTHDQTEAFSVADKVAVLHAGNLQQFATPEDLYRKPETITVANFLGFKNLIPGHIDGNNIFRSELGDFQLEGEERVARSTNLLIRPDIAKLVDTDTTDTTPPHISGKIMSSQFTGSRYKMKISTKGFSLTFTLPIDPAPPRVGQDIHLSLKTEALCLVDDETVEKVAL